MNCVEMISRQKSKEVLITGATGYVGRHLTAAVAKSGYGAYILTQAPTPLFQDIPSVVSIIGDISDVFEIPESVETIYHCAGVIYNEKEMERVNVEGTKNIISLARKNNCKLIYLSSAGIVGKTNKRIIDEETPCHPHNPYEVSKYKAEVLVQTAIEEGLDAQILRPTTIFGPRMNDNSFLQLVQSMRSGLYKNIGEGMYNIIHIDEVVKALQLLGAAITPGDVYIVNDPISYKEMDSVVKCAEPTIHKKTYRVPQPIAYMGSITLSFLSFITHKRNPLTLARLLALTNKTVYSQAKIENILSFTKNKRTDEHITEVCAEYIRGGTRSN